MTDLPIISQIWTPRSKIWTDLPIVGQIWTDRSQIETDMDSWESYMGRPAHNRSDLNTCFESDPDRPAHSRADLNWYGSDLDGLAYSQLELES